MSTPDPSTAGLTILGHEVRHPVAHVECFPAPAGVSTVRFTTDELMSMCPVTTQPDLSHLVIEYEPRSKCVESKSLKLYLWSFRDRAVFVRLLDGPHGDAPLATSTIERVLDEIEWPLLNELKHTSIPR